MAKKELKNKQNNFFVYGKEVWQLLTKHPRIDNTPMKKEALDMVKNARKYHLPVWKAINCNSNKVFMVVVVREDVQFFETMEDAFKSLQLGNYKKEGD